MTEKHSSDDRVIVRASGQRTGLWFLCFLVFGLVFFAFHTVFELPGEGITVSISMLFAFPACLGALSVLLVDASGRKGLSAGWVAFSITMGVLLIGSIVLREGVICVAILAPIWSISCLFGAWSVTSLQQRLRSQLTFNSSILFMLPFLMMGIERQIPQVATDYVVQREVMIAATPEDVWPHLLRMERISEDEGRWNITQNMFAVPRPAAAIVHGEGVGAIRHAQWGEHVTFEEHISLWEEHSALSWTFVFPNDSVHKYTDEHLAPDGLHLRINEGGYRLERLGEGRTRLVLYTAYQAQTPINAYTRLWGELFLGDLQQNILTIVKDRSER